MYNVHVEHKLRSVPTEDSVTDTSKCTTKINEKETQIWFGNKCHEPVVSIGQGRNMDSMIFFLFLFSIY